MSSPDENIFCADLSQKALSAEYLRREEHIELTEGLTPNAPVNQELVAALEFLDTVLEPRLKRVVLPMLDSTEHIVQRGRDLFGLEVRDGVIYATGVELRTV